MTIIVGSGSVLLGIAAAAISLLALAFAVYSWRQANRPLISARVTSPAGGDAGILLNLVVENTGNRPARDIRFTAKNSDVRAASQTADIPADAQRMFFSGIDIPVLANGRSISNAFWHLGRPDSWRAGAKFPVKITYKDLAGRRFSSKLRLFLADDNGFAQTSWGVGHAQDG